MYRIVKVFIVLFFWCLGCCLQASNMSTEQYCCDVDSLGDLWIFNIDKTGSMLQEKCVDNSIKYWSPRMISDDVLGKLSKGILNKIDYSRDRITIFTTGYGTTQEDSYGYNFCRARELEYSFIHLEWYLTKCKDKESIVKNLCNILRRGDYNYRESFVSQIRVLSLHRLVEYIEQVRLNSTFRKIYIVTITDDADVNDQWKMDYYTIKRDPNKIKHLNSLHTKYVYSSLLQNGGGRLEELEEYTDVSSKNHIYLYEYLTLQQNVKDIICSEDSIIHLSPLDGRKISIKRNLDLIETDSINLLYIDTICINGNKLGISRYMYDTLTLMIDYDFRNLSSNQINIKGKVQVAYKDSIYGEHFKSYAFEQNNSDYSSNIHLILLVIVLTLILVLIGIIVYFIYLSPNKVIMRIYKNNKLLCIRRGYKWNWDRITPLCYSTDLATVFAKHSCFKNTTHSYFEKIEHSGGFVIDSPVPLKFTKDYQSVTSKDNFSDANLHFSPIKAVYNKSLAGHLVFLKKSRNRWIRLKLYPFINNILFRISPHYYYSGKNLDGLMSTQYIKDHQFMMEHIHNKKHYNNNDLWLNTYYQGNFKRADVIICIERNYDSIIWNVYQLNIGKFSNRGISIVKHLIHYKHSSISSDEINLVKNKLIGAIEKEMGIKNIVCIDEIKVLTELVSFEVEEATCMSYICLVESTVQEKCQIIYSPFRDTENKKKNIVVESSTVSRHIWTSLFPFKNKKDRCIDNIARKENDYIVREGPVCQKSLILGDNEILFDNIHIKIK